MDVKALGDWLAANGLSLVLTLAALSFGIFVLLRLARRWEKIEEGFSANWRLGLLGTTGLVLSLASGWTTWDGMRNFTREPVLSGMITFGIQGVMLIVAWLIGESFATGMSGVRTGGGGAVKTVRAVSGGILGILTFLVLVLLGMHTLGLIDVRMPDFVSFDWSRSGDRYLLIAALVLVSALVAFSGTGLARPYVEGARIIIRNAVLWVMFLACMATSVFFSFDSLFSVIFSQDERVRAAELRAQNQVAGVIADIGQTLAARRKAEAQALFETEAWRAYDRQLGRVAEALRQSEGALARYFHEQVEARSRAVREQQERIATAQAGLAGLDGRKAFLTGELARLKGERPALAAEYAEKKNGLDARTREAEAKRIEALAEDKGVEGSGKEGKGPVWRQRMAELSKLQAARAVSEERFRDVKKRLDAIDARTAQTERELAALDGELAKFKSEMAAAGERIRLAAEEAGAQPGTDADPARLLPVFEKARAGFRQDPSAARLSALHGLCSRIFNALTQTDATRAGAKGLECDPKSANEAMTVLFALNAGQEAFAANCAGGSRLAGLKTVDGLFGFARKCLADAGLPSKETDALRARINNMELNRDDRAHRFVVTWNAFEDGNRLAYLALAIAVAIDSLIFMSGLFGANATRSPLQDVPQTSPRSAQRLEAAVNSALGVRRYETAALVLSVLRPAPRDSGFPALATFGGLAREHADRVRRVLTAGAEIGAVEPVSTNPESYLVRGELREYLALICDRHLRSDPSHARRDQLESILRAALQPYPKEHAEFVASVFEPIKATQGFTSTVLLRDIAGAYENRLVRRVMNAGATLDAVRPDSQDGDRYYITPELYRVLLEIAAHDPPSPHYVPSGAGLLPGGHRPSHLEGGDITPRPGAIADQRPVQPALPPEEKRGEPEKPADASGGEGFWGRWFGGGRKSPSPAADAAAPADNAPEAVPPPPAELPAGIVRGFAGALALRRAELEALMGEEEAGNLAPAIDAHLSEAASRDLLLGGRIEALKREKREAIAHAAAELRRNGEDRAAVEGLARVLHRMVPLVLLAEYGAYPKMLDSLLMEAGRMPAREFPGGRQQDWLRIVQDHIDDLARIPRSGAENWRRVDEALARLSRRLEDLGKAGKYQHA